MPQLVATAARNGTLSSAAKRGARTHAATLARSGGAQLGATTLASKHAGQLAMGRSGTIADCAIRELAGVESSSSEARGT